MPTKNGLGWSENTPIKEIQFEEFIRTHIKIATSIINKNDWAEKKYWYFDLNSGPGFNPEGSPGSPLIFLKIAAQYPNNRFHVVLMEKNKKSYNSLIEAISPWEETLHLTIDCLHGDHNNLISEYLCSKEQNRLKARFGLIYNDPTGSPPSFSLFQRISNKQFCFNQTDFLIYCSAANVKRICKSPLCQSIPRINEGLMIMNKKHWLIRKPMAKHQWTFLFGCQWTQFPVLSNLGFHRFDSPSGISILQQLSLTADEIEKKTQPYLIEITKNI